MKLFAVIAEKFTCTSRAICISAAESLSVLTPTSTLPLEKETFTCPSAVNDASLMKVKA